MTLRSLRKFKIYSLINILGLAVGLVYTILIFLWLQDELSFDKFHQDSEQIYRITTLLQNSGNKNHYAGSPAPIGPAAQSEFPEVTKFSRLQSGWTGWHLHYGNKNFMEERLACADPSFFEIFQYEFLEGDPKVALTDRHSIVLTENLAKKCFGNEDPMGKIIQMDDIDMLVTGVIKNTPQNSHIQFDYIFPIINMTEWRGSRIRSWEYLQFATYLKLSENANPQQVNQKLNDLVKKNSPNSKLNLVLQPLEDIHLHSNELNNWMVVYSGKGNITYVYIFFLIAVAILLLACVNFMNLSTARAGMRVREVGIRKVIGAQRKNLITQFLGESIIFTFIALGLALIIVEIILPVFSELASKNLSLNIADNYLFSLLILSVSLITGLISGSYPALYLSSFNPTGILKELNKFKTGKGGNIRRILVVGQFTFTIILIMTTIVIFGQLNYIYNKNLGFDQENIIYFAANREYHGNYDTAKNELLQNPAILNISQAFPPSQGYGGTTDVDWEGKNPDNEITFFNDMVDFEFANTFGIQMTDGRFYSREFTTDAANYVLNETAIKKMNLKDPIGKRFTYLGNPGVIIGVAKDYHGGSLHEPILPKVLKLIENGPYVCVKFKAGNTAQIIRYLETNWKKFAPNFPFKYSFLDVTINEYYKTEKRIGTLNSYATFLAIFIACIGLFGLTSFMIERRTKEIGIRKVLGASVTGIVHLLSREFTTWVLLANILALPIGGYLMQNWLYNFAYRISIDWWIYAAAGSSALLIALITVSFQAVKTAIANPIESLRYE
jgi:putative ABC transport system permease protein